MTSVPSSTTASPWNVPNLLTASRFVLSVVVFALIGYGMYLTALVAFVIAAGTDWIDGYWARRYGQVTKLGRIFDPFVDKIIICGTFIVLVAIPESGIAAWMAIVVVGRELLVTSLRGLIEGAGGDFSASQLGKWKMVLQCAAVVLALACLMQHTIPAWLDITRHVTIWAAIALTLYSGLDYVWAAARLMRAPAEHD